MECVNRSFEELDIDDILLTEFEPKKDDTIHASSIGDGLVYSLKNLGKVDIHYIAKITGESKDKVIEKLKGSIYKEPTSLIYDKYEGYKTSDEYLSGNLFRKLETAKIYNRNGNYNINIEALKSVMPKGLSGEEIYYNLSSPWIPKQIIKDFFNYSFIYKVKDDEETLVYLESIGAWKINVKSARASYAANYRFGTSRINALKIFEHIINSKNIAIYNTLTTPNGKKKVLDKEATEEAISKSIEIEAYFKRYVEARSWIYKDLVDTYNANFSYNVTRHYNGDFLDFPNINPAIKLFKYQRNAIARIIFNNNTLLAHNVGAGKTYIMIAAGEELLRMGISNKNLYVVPNNILGQWEKDYKKLYPNAQILVLDVDNFTPKKIDSTLELMKNSGYKTIIIPSSSFDRLPLSIETEKELISQRIKDLESDEVRYCTNFSKAKESLREKLEKLEDKIDSPYAFENLGFNRIFVDEAHNYKNIPLRTNRSNVRNINVLGSNKCEHLKLICDYFNNSTNGGIIFATGTPITNSISDIYNIQICLQKNELCMLNLDKFDNWLSMYVENQNEVEVDLEGTGYRTVTRLSKFHNLPELTQLLSNIADFHYHEDDNIPKFNGYKDIIVKRSRELKNYINEISERIDNIKFGVVTMKEDNLLKVTSDGRKAALDLRLIDEYKYQNYNFGKVFECAEKVCEIYVKTKDDKNTQLVFCDTSVPNSRFNVYDELKRTLVGFGVDENDIKFIHDATTDKKREELFQKVNNGEVRILIGSTQKLGTGVNVQKRLIAIHHLDVPWRPADMIQREGRIIRRGNSCKEVDIYRYIAEGSFDSYSWQILESKQKLISEILSNSLADRNKEDLDNVVLSYSEVKALATGNPRLKDHILLTNKITKLKMLQKIEANHISQIKRDLLEIPNKISNLKEKITNMKADIELLNNNRVELDTEDKNELRKLIWDTLTSNIGLADESEIVEYNGFKILSPADLSINYLYLVVKGNNTYFVELGNSEVGALIRLDNFFNSLPKKLDEAIEEVDKLSLKEEACKGELSNIKDYSYEIEECMKNLKELEKELGL